MDFDALERLLADELYESDTVGSDPLNIVGWINDIEAEDATIEEMLSEIVKDDDQRARIQNMIDFL